LSPGRSALWILSSFLLLMLRGVTAGCDSQAGSIDVQKAPPVGIEDETRPLKSPATPKAR